MEPNVPEDLALLKAQSFDLGRSKKLINLRPLIS